MKSNKNDRFWEKTDPEKRKWIMWDVATIETLAHPNLAIKKKVITPHDILQRTINVYTSIDAEEMTQDYWKAIKELP